MSAVHNRPVVLDADEFDHLPDNVHVPIEGVDAARRHVNFRLREMTRGGTALLVYSSRSKLLAAHGENAHAITLPSVELPVLQRRLRFNVVLLDVRPTSGLTQRNQQLGPDELQLAAIDADVDRSTGEPLIYVPSRPYRVGDSEAELELQPLANGGLALLTYSSKRSLLDACGPHQHYVRFPVGMLQDAMRQAGADQVLINTPLPDYLRH